MFVYSFYKFERISDLSIKKNTSLKNLDKLNVKGTILISTEGINVNLSQSEELLNQAVNFIDKEISLEGVHFNKTKCSNIAFEKLKVKIKKEIIRFDHQISERKNTPFKRVLPNDWDELISSDAQVIDMRNNFEFNLGTFNNAINLKMINFTDLKDRTDDLDQLDKKKKTAIFCTGGIRCEKAAEYLSDIGFDKIFQLEGGIINYLSNTEGESWNGDCFVFDDRILLKSNL